MLRFKNIIHYIIPYKYKALLSVLFNLLASIFSVISLTMIIPFLGVLFSSQQVLTNVVPFRFNASSIHHNFNYYLGKIMSDKGQVDALLAIIIIVAIFTLLKNLFFFLGRSYTVHLRTHIIKDIRNKLLNKILDFDLSYFSSEKRGDIISKMTLDVKEIEISIINSIEILFKDPILIIIYVYVLCIISLKLTLFVLIIFPISMFFINRIGKSLKRTSYKGQKRMGALISVLDEIIGGIKGIKAYSSEEFFKNRFFKINEKYTRLLEKVWRKRTFVTPISDVVSTFTILIILWFGSKMVLTPGSTFTSQNFIGYLAVFTQLVSPVRSFSNGYYNIIKGMASIDRINSILNFPYQIDEIENPVKVNEFKSSIEFKKVSFFYEIDNKMVLSDINLSIKKGEVIAIVGHSGAGKTTLVDLIPRFYDPTEGQILFDEVPLKDMNIDNLRNMFGYVNQQAILFNDTIYNNIVFGRKDVSFEDVEIAARLANAHDFITKKENGYESSVGENGSKISLGEKQRISIARAILKNPSILILDEATSALDNESEMAIREAIESIMKNRTTIVIAHRLSTVKNANQIVVLDKGKIVEIGTHEELVKNNGIYSRLSYLEMF